MGAMFGLALPATATMAGAGALVLFNDVVCAFEVNAINVKPINKPVLKSFVNVFFIVKSDRADTTTHPLK